MANHVIWFDIPVIDLDRSISFYSKVLDIEINKDFPDQPIGVFSHA